MVSLEKKLRRTEEKGVSKAVVDEMKEAKERSHRCMEEIMAVCKKYNCRLQISQGIETVPLRIEGENVEEERAES